LFGGLTEKLKEFKMPEWVTFDAEKKAGTLVSAPAYSREDSAADMDAVFEYYTR
jgi:hypothetical protein